MECFKIRVYKSSSIDLTKLDFSNPVFDILCNRKRYTYRPVDIVADPFLFVFKDKMFLFYEAKRMYEKGVINMVCTEDGCHWSKPLTVLNEEYHLSYPFVFEENGCVYMIPETCSAHSIRMYKADCDSLTSFSFYSTLVERQRIDPEISIDFSDSSILKKNGLFYLFTTINRGGLNTLLLYYSRQFDSGYHEHPLSPIIVSQKFGRCAGSIIENKGKLYRLAQDCENGYGNNIHLFGIQKLSETDYHEIMIKDNLFDKKNPFYKNGGHQINLINFKGVYYIATDAKEHHKFLFSRILYRIAHIIQM